jgi:primosomal protein N' (replication factor Y) (superfamily II helicase)
MKENKYIIQVAPLTPLPILRTQVYSYLHERPLPNGTLVTIPFYFREINGVVINSRKDFPRYGSMKLKNIKNVIELSYLTENQIKLAQNISSYYLSSLGMVLKSMIPKRVMLRSAKKGVAKKRENLKTAKNIKEAHAIIKSTGRYFLLKGSSEKRKEVIIGLIREGIKIKKQSLILVPEIYFTHGIYEQIKVIFPNEEIAVMHSQTTKGQFYDWWQKIKSGEVKIVVASKIGVFLPFQNLGLIVVKQEADLSHKQWDKNPRYNAVKAAEFMAQIFGSKIVFDSSFYSADVLRRSQKHNFKIVRLAEKLKKNIRVEIVDLFPEKDKADFPISSVLYKYLAEAIKSKRRAILLVNRRGYSTFTVCLGCKAILKCPECDRALVYFDEYEQYRCLHCSHKMDLLSSCPRCGGFQFSHFGIGIQTVEKKIKKLFPTARIARLDSDVMKSAKRYKEIHDDFRKNKIDVLIGTQIAVKDIGIEKVYVAGIISAHDFLSIPDFNSREVALAHFFGAKDHVSEEGALVIQTFSPNDLLLNYIRSENQEDFYKSEIRIRKKLLYPPFSRLIKLVYRDKIPKKSEKEIQKIFDLLKNVSDNEIEISDPYTPMASKKRGLYSRSILIKLSPNKNLSNLPIYSIIGGLRKGWIADVDPVTTI